jgi:hypothetical protein
MAENTEACKVLEADIKDKVGSRLGNQLNSLA